MHSTALGPSLGGVRFWTYASEADAVADALRLSEAMTYKAAVAGLHQGGGKAVVLLDDPDAPHTPAMLRALGLAIDELGGRYLAAEDVGATPADMEALALETPWVTGVAEAAGGSGDPSPVTAYGVLHAMRAAALELDGTPSLDGWRVAVQGAGHVGVHLVRMLVEEGAHVVVADAREGRARAIAQELAAVEAVPAGEIVGQDCDLLAPCALGGVVDAETVGTLRCRAICGAANNQLASDEMEDLLVERGILYVPDFVANAGGIINIAEEFTGYSQERALARAAEIFDTVRSCARNGATSAALTPGRAALLLARDRVEREGGGRRWRPGDPAAWTHGEPLRTLRRVPLRPRGSGVGVVRRRARRGGPRCRARSCAARRRDVAELVGGDALRVRPVRVGVRVVGRPHDLVEADLVAVADAVGVLDERRPHVVAEVLARHPGQAHAGAEPATEEVVVEVVAEVGDPADARLDRDDPHARDTARTPRCTRGRRAGGTSRSPCRSDAADVR